LPVLVTGVTMYENAHRSRYSAGGFRRGQSRAEANCGFHKCDDVGVTFELLDHPADIGFRARGATLEELFSGCARALVSIILDPSAIRPIESISIPGTGGDLESLLVNWLNEVLYHVDGRRIALGEFAIAHVDETSVECMARGERLDPERHPSRAVVKAVTYHQLKVERTRDDWVAEVYVDV
jgi:SHS2 domain-containing protein